MLCPHYKRYAYSKASINAYLTDILPQALGGMCQNTYCQTSANKKEMDAVHGFCQISKNSKVAWAISLLLLDMSFSVKTSPYDSVLTYMH